MNLINFSIINKIKNYLLINNKLIFIIFSAFFILSLKFININIYIFYHYFNHKLNYYKFKIHKKYTVY